MPLAEKGVRGKGRQPLSPPQHTVARSANSAPKWLSQHSAVRTKPTARRTLRVSGDRELKLR